MSAYLIKAMGTPIRLELEGVERSASMKGLLRLKPREKTCLSLVLERRRERGGDRSLPCMSRRTARGTLKVSFDIEQRTARCMLSPAAPPAFGLNFGLNYSLKAFQRDLDIFFFHASAVIMNGKACLFSAPSGGGKSTMCRLAESAGLEVISEDTCVVKRRGREFFVAPFPLPPMSETPAEGREIGAVYFLNKAKRDAVRPVSFARAMKRAMPESLVYFPREMDCFTKSAYSEHVFGSLCAMLENVPFGELDFKKTTEVFGCLG